MTSAEKKPVGRPRKYAGKRPTWTIRLEEKYGDQIKAMAEESGRSISEVCEQQIVDAFRMEIICDIFEKKVEKLTQELADCRLELSAANMGKEKAEQQAQTYAHHILHSDQRAVDLEASRESLLLRVDDLVSLLAKTAGVPSSIGSDARQIRDRPVGIFARRKGRRQQKLGRPKNKAV